jgi:hypothetical protein
MSPTARIPKPVREATRKRLPSRADTVTTSITLARPVHQRAVMAAVTRNWTLTEVFRQALDEWLDRHAPTTKGGPR